MKKQHSCFGAIWGDHWVAYVIENFSAIFYLKYFVETGSSEIYKVHITINDYNLKSHFALLYVSKQQ